MSRAETIAIAFFLLAAAFTASIEARRSYSSPRHSYPSHSGHSGHSSHSSQSHSYPSSGGLSGSHSHGSGSPSHSYPSSGGLSGTGSHGYPSSGGLSGSGSRGQPAGQHTPHQQANGHAYPSSPGLSGNGQGGASNVHYHQHVYQAPQQIHYTPVHGAAPAHPYPVYHGQPPVYVHEIRDSGSRYSTLLTGLALYNLGRSTSGYHHHDSSQSQAQQADGERCTLRIEQDRNLEKVKIPCYIVTTFTDASDVKAAVSTPQPIAQTTPSIATSSLPATTIAPPTPNVTLTSNVTSAINATVPQGNNTLVTNADNSTHIAHNTPVAVQNSTVTVQNATATNTTAEPVDAVKVKGEPLRLSNGARCFVEKVTKTRTSVKEIECGLLQQYALQSMQRQQQRPRNPNAAYDVRSSIFTLLTVTIGVYLVC